MSNSPSQPSPGNPMSSSQEGHKSHVLVSATGDVLTSKNVNTKRDQDRTQEEVRYTSVILKRNDLTLRHPGDTLEIAIHEGLEQFKRNQVSLLLSSLAAGLNVAFSAMAVAIAYAVAMPMENPLVSKFLVALVYPLGFIICIMSGAKLFTEHTATALYPVLDGQAKLSKLFKLWGIVLSGNLVGATVSAFLLTIALPVIKAKEGFLLLGHHLVDPTSEQLLISAILAGWLMAQGGWLVMASTSTLAQMMGIYIVTFIIGLAGFHHSIAGTAEMMAALFMGNEFTLFQTGRFILISVLGNLLGGSIFVGVLNYAHIRQLQKQEK